MASYQPRAAKDLDKPARTEKEILAEARDRLQRCIDENSDNRKAQMDDLRFCTLDQWPAEIRAARESDPNGPRPCLTIDQANQYLDQVVNDCLQNKPAVKIRPVDEGGDIETAEILQGLVRQIEDQSVAEIAYGGALRSAVRVGEGYFRVITEYENDKSFNQQIRIKPIQDTFCCYLGYHVMPDGSDAEWGFIFEDIPLETFRRMYPKAKYQSTEFDELENYWYEDEKIRICEYFYFDYENQDIVFIDGQTLTRQEYDQLPEPKPEIQDERTTRIKSVKWCKHTAIEILEKRDWAGKYIPIVKVIGKESWINGKRVVWGLVRPGKDSLRMYNYWASSVTEKIALSPKSPFVMAEGQVENHEAEWRDANKVNFAYLSYKPVSVDGLSVPPPQRQMPAPIEVAMVQQMQQIREDVQASFGMFKAALGKEQPNQSGKAILALTRESDTGTFHFSNNQKISIMYCGRILVDLIPKIMDTQQVIRVVGEDGKVNTAEINPELPTARQDIRLLEGKIKKIYNLGVGTYDVTATVGPSFNTKRMEAAAMFTDLSNSAKDPASAAVVRYLAIKNSDFNGAEDAAEMMEKLLPPGIVKQDGQPQIPPQVAAQMQQMQQVIQLQQQELQKLQAGEQQAQAKIAVDAKEGQAKIAADHDAKMKQLAVDAEIQAKELELQRQKVEAEIALKRAQAECDITLKRAQAESDAAISDQKNKNDMEVQTKKVENDRQIKEQELTFKIECEKKEQEAKAESEMAPKVVEKIMKELSEAIKKSTETNEALLEAVIAPKKIDIQQSNGLITGATVRPQRTLN